MATNQSFLDGLRSVAGFGANYARTPDARSADQNNTVSGNPGYSSNMTPSWQQMVMNRQNEQASLAQNPTNINYIQPQPNQFSAVQQRMNQLDPRGAPTPQMIAQMQARAQQTAGNQVPLNGGGMAGMGMQFNNSPLAAQRNLMMNPNGGMNYIQPRAVLPIQQMGGGGGPMTPRGGYTPDQMAAGPSGFRFVRPMMR